MGKEQYGNSSKAVGRKPSINKHPASNPEGTSDEPFSQMVKVDHKESHNKALKNMAAPAQHQKSMPISDHHAYKRQSHAEKPSGPIQSFVGNRVDSNPSKAPAMNRPKGKEAEYDKINEEDGD